MITKAYINATDSKFRLVHINCDHFKNGIAFRRTRIILRNLHSDPPLLLLSSLFTLIIGTYFCFVVINSLVFFYIPSLIIIVAKYCLSLILSGWFIQLVQEDCNLKVSRSYFPSRRFSLLPWIPFRAVSDTLRTRQYGDHVVGPNAGGTRSR